MPVPEREKVEQLLKNATNPRPRAVEAPLLKKINSQQPLALADPPDGDIPGSQPQAAKEKNTISVEDETNNTPVFKAVGVIQGEVTLNEDRINSVTIDGKSYQLRYAAEKHKRMFEKGRFEPQVRLRGAISTPATPILS